MPRIGSGVPLVARGPELETLRAALRAAGQGQAGAVLLAGDAGVGKSRLLAELVTEARSAGVTVLTGRCLDVDEAGLPYLPFVEALGQLGRDVVGARPVLARLAPGLAPAEPQDTSDQGMEQLRLFDAVHGLLSDLAADGHVLLALEDLHWADTSTRDLVLFLLSRLATQRVLVVATYRVDDLHRRHPLRPLLAELSRLSTVERVELAPFEHSDAMSFVSALTDGALPENTVRKIAERSEGNAFFCEELAAVYGDGAGVPTGLAELLLARVERLGHNARRVVRAASGAGQSVTHASLCAVSELSDDVLDDALRESVQHNVLLTEDEGYTFRHALLREAVYGDLLPGERVRLHAGYARVATTAAALAYHSLKSHDLPRALTASVKAATEAREMRAPGESLLHIEQALQLWSAVPEPTELTGTDELSLLRSAAVMAIAAGEAERAIAYARTAVAQADLHDDPELSADARHQLAWALIPQDTHGPELTELIEQAWALVQDLPPSATRAKILALRARVWVWAGMDSIKVEGWERLAQEAIDNAQQVGAGEVEVDALVTLAVFAEWDGRADEAIQLGWAAAERAAAIGAFDVELRAMNNIAVNNICQGRLRESARVLDRLCRRAREVGLTWGERGRGARSSQIAVLFCLGEWQEALAAGSDTAGAPRSAADRVSATLLYVLVAMGRFAEADELSAQIRQRCEDAITLGFVDIAASEAAGWRGRHAEAVGHARAMIDGMAGMTRPAVIEALWATNNAVSSLADLAERARRDKDSDAERQAIADFEELYTEARRYFTRYLRFPADQEANSPEYRAHRSRMIAELSRLRGHDDPALWRIAVEQAEDQPYWRAIARWRLASALLGSGGREEAGDLLRLVHAEAVRLGAQPLRDAVAGLAKRARISLGDEEPEEVSNGLTPREHAVLELVASGMTNKQVGAQLYISEKTASVHLSRVMSKLGAGSRTEAVSIAHDLGLLS